MRRLRTNRVYHCSRAVKRGVLPPSPKRPWLLRLDIFRRHSALHRSAATPCLIVLALGCLIGTAALAAEQGANAATGSHLAIDLTNPDVSVMSGHLKMGGKNPQGVEINVNSRYLTLAGKPWFPVMGEFHFSRYPREQWEEELLKMKAGGITVVSTYIFWIYHEEVEGQFDWSGSRDLHSFVQLCAKHGLYCYPRLGPWAHGEARNGGVPDWVLQKCGRDIRKDAEPYMTYARRFYAEIGKQLQGLLWKDGGPVIGVQLENEYHGSPSHMLTLKKIARELGIEVPLYTMTGWDRVRVPEGDEFIPVFGGYPDGFWVNGVSTWARDGRKQYFFGLERDDSTIGNDLKKRQGTPDSSILARYPYGTCEIGGGMQVSYRRRPVIEADDVAAMALAKLGSGSNIQGYYMYHGGSHPLGKLSTMNESRATGYPNDMPVIDYDFQAPLGEFGQERGSYGALRLQHMFLQDFGSDLAPLPAVMPVVKPTGMDDMTTLRWAARSDGKRGYVFINNYQHVESLPDHDNVQLELRLKAETLVIPDKPIRIPRDAYMIWPFNMNLGGALLKYATAQPLCRVGECYVFFRVPGVDAEFVFDPQTITWPTRPRIAAPKQETDSFFTVRAREGGGAKILLLTQESARHHWKANIWGSERLFLSTDGLTFDGDKVCLQSHNSSGNSVWSIMVDPAPPPEIKGAVGNVITGSTTSASSLKIDVECKQIKPAGPAKPVKTDDKGVAFVPDDAAFDGAGVWQVSVPKDALNGAHEVFLRIDYAGDIGRAYLGDQLISDDYYFGRVWEIGLKRFAPEVLEKGLTLKILPLRKDSPVYMPKDRWPSFGGKNQLAEVRSVTVQPEFEIAIAPGQKR